MPKKIRIARTINPIPTPDPMYTPTSAGEGVVVVATDVVVVIDVVVAVVVVVVVDVVVVMGQQ